MIPFLRKLILQDVWLKLFSFVLAVLTWITINSMADQKEGIATPILPPAPSEQLVLPNLPVVILSSAQDVRSFRVNPKEVEVTVQGDPKIVKALQAKDIRVLVDLTGIGAAHDLRKRIEVSSPAGITHVKVDPGEVQVIFPPRN